MKVRKPDQPQALPETSGAKAAAEIFAASRFEASAVGPLYLQLRARITEAIETGQLRPGESLPAERDIAAMANLSRVTVRKAVEQLVAAGRLVQRRGSGTFVAPTLERVEMPLSQLNSFTEDMARRGRETRAIWLERALARPSTDEVMVLGLNAHEQVARLARVRLSDGVPLAIERASLPETLLPDPQAVRGSLYEYLGDRGLRPVRAVQRISAANIDAETAGLLEMAEGAAGLQIERISYLETGRVVEITRSIYRGDAYDFTAELRIPSAAERSST
ncbi:GntR family transcriptional regulator [Thioclava sp. BHET1]|nr:GntR family transcriptional regulator [Thioclava sp. BHET1]